MIVFFHQASSESYYNNNIILLDVVRNSMASSGLRWLWKNWM